MRLSFIYSLRARNHRCRGGGTVFLKKGRHEPGMVCPRIYANMCIFMPIYSQLSVFLGGKVASLAKSQRTSQSFSPCWLCWQGGGSHECCAREGCGVLGQGLCLLAAAGVRGEGAGPCQVKPWPGELFFPCAFPSACCWG